MKIFKFLRNLRCKHTETLLITDLSDYYKEIYNGDSIVICKNCGKFIVANKSSNSNIINFTPKGE